MKRRRHERGFFATRSRFLSLVLRHRPGLAGIELDAAGWAPVDALLAGCARASRALNLDELHRLVAENDKQRFEFNHDGTRIRARQGHSVEVDLGYAAATPPAVLLHGTVPRFLPAIRARGLERGARHDVHLTADPDAARRTGARRGEPVVLRVDAAAMQAAGHEFFVTDNDVWLVAHVPPQFIDWSAVDRT